MGYIGTILSCSLHADDNLVVQCGRSEHAYARTRRVCEEGGRAIMSVMQPHLVVS
jgi:hypothetical protein